MSFETYSQEVPSCSNSLVYIPRASKCPSLGVSAECIVEKETKESLRSAMEGENQGSPTLWVPFSELSDLSQQQISLQERRGWENKAIWLTWVLSPTWQQTTHNGKQQTTHNGKQHWRLSNMLVVAWGHSSQSVTIHRRWGSPRSMKCGATDYHDFRDWALSSLIFSVDACPTLPPHHDCLFCVFLSPRHSGMVFPGSLICDFSLFSGP
jgi:hypothetical protein